MLIEVAEPDILSNAVLAELRALQKAVYPPEVLATSPGRDTTWAPPQWHILMRDDTGHLVSHVGFGTSAGTLDGQPARIGGIGGVFTHPLARGQGYAGTGLRKAMTMLADELGADFALLVCQPHLIPFYARLGWQQFAGTLLVRQPNVDGAVPFTINEAMVAPAVRPAPHAGTIDLCSYPW
jgi:aminoglycoside 2'-N-acetyltransferase I